MSIWLIMMLIAAAYMVLGSIGWLMILLTMSQWYETRKRIRRIRKLKYYRAEDWETPPKSLQS